jgi:hypothetical protein
MKKIVGIMLKAFTIMLLLNTVCLMDEWSPPDQYSEQNVYPDFAYDGQNFFVVWGGDDIYGRILSPEGNFVTPILRISSKKNIESEPEIVYLNPSFLIVWEEHLGDDSVRICCKKYNRYYSPINNSWTELLSGNGLSSPRVEKHTDGFAALWFEWNVVQYDCHASLFDINGNQYGVQLDGYMPYIDPKPYSSVQPLVRADNADRYFLCGKSSALILDQSFNTINDIDLPRYDESYPCYGHNKWINIAAADTHSYFENLIITKVSFDGTVIPPEKITIEREGVFSNLTVCTGDNIFLCVWQQSNDGNSTVNYIRLDSDGNFIDEESSILSENIDLREARLKYAKNKFFLLWKAWNDEEGNGQIRCCILSQEGDSLSGRIITISE